MSRRAIPPEFLLCASTVRIAVDAIDRSDAELARLEPDHPIAGRIRRRLARRRASLHDLYQVAARQFAKRWCDRLCLPLERAIARLDALLAAEVAAARREESAVRRVRGDAA